MNPKISIIVPIYNTEKYLEECLDSILRQSMRDIEVICINDGSTDSSAQLCDAIMARDKRVVVVHKENGGLSSARNTGIEHAKGQYILFVDSDDWISPFLCQQIYDKAIETDADLIQFFYQEELRDGCNKPPRVSEISEVSYETAYDKLSIAFNSGPMVWKFLWKTDLIRQNRLYFTDKILYEDFEYTAKGALLANRIAIVPQFLYHYRQRTSSISFGNSYKKKVEGFMVSINKALVFAQLHKVPMSCIYFLVGRKYKMLYVLSQRVGIRSYLYYRSMIKSNCRNVEKDIVYNHLLDLDKSIKNKITAIIGTPKEIMFGSFSLIGELLLHTFKNRMPKRKFYE